MSALVRARGQIMFLLGLILASGIVFWLNRLESVPVSDIEPASALVYTPPAQVQAAWNWFEKNTDSTSSLVSGAPADDAHLLRATIAAHRLGLINGRELYERLDRALASIESRDPRQRSDADGAALISALELIAWSYPANSSDAVKMLDKLRAGRSSGVTRSAVPPASVAAGHAEVLVRAAVERRGDK